MSLRPILIKHKDEEETVILTAQLSQPTLSSRNVEAMMTQKLLGIDSIQHQLYSSILDYKEGLLKAFHNQLLLYLQDNSVFYKNEIMEMGMTPVHFYLRLVILLYTKTVERKSTSEFQA